MRHAALWIGIGALALAGSCTRDDQKLADKLDEIGQRTERMEKQLASIATGRPQRRQRPADPRDPAKTYAIPIAGSPVTGNPDAPVTIVEGFEFACGWCEKSRGLVKEVLDEYGDKVRLVHKSYLIHPDVATVPALAGCAANKQGKFAAIEPLIWDKGFKARKFTREHMVTLATEAGLDIQRFESDLDSGECAAQIKREQAELARVGTRGTPTFFVNGRWLERRSKAEFKRLIDEELAKAEKRLAAGSPAAGYYDEWVVAKGSKKL